MNPRKKQISFLIFLIILIITINYSLLDAKLQKFLDNKETAIVTRVIDGDTIKIGNKSVRLLGINTPEKGEEYYSEAKDFLEMIALNKTIELEFGKNKYDRYNRILAYVFIRGKNVNVELVDEGYANYYFPSGKDKYYDVFVKNWEHCLSNNKYLCEKSVDKCTSCIQLKNFDYKNERIVFENICDFNCDLSGWKIKDEGRKNFVFPEFVLKAKENFELKIGEGINSENILFWKDQDYVWTKTGDTLFLRDNKNRLVLWESY